MPVSVLTVLVAAVVITIGVIVHYKAKLRSSARSTREHEVPAYEDVEQQPRAARNETSAAVEQQTADTTTDTDGMGYQLVDEPAAATRVNPNIAYGFVL